ncbi:hypothetical protein CI610_01752 [invertebrate metagenome]|uniref:Uncharacterized protein n=1 Tax=invertebrate metagenome TaxID=1711999 RepID=A0A2H9T7W0_9ZZZZ
MHSEEVRQRNQRMTYKIKHHCIKHRTIPSGYVTPEAAKNYLHKKIKDDIEQIEKIMKQGYVQATKDNRYQIQPMDYHRAKLTIAYKKRLLKQLNTYYQWKPM